VGDDEGLGRVAEHRCREPLGHVASLAAGNAYRSRIARFGLPLAATGARGGRELACRRESGISCGKDAGCQRFGAWIDGVTGELRAGLRNAPR
jgi:hypothetical protein